MRNVSANQQAPSTVARPDACSQSIDWYSEGETRIVEANGVRVIVRFVGRHGRRGRIAITAPPGATFRSVEPSVTDADQSQRRHK
jgi:hypothetical protein